MSPQGTVRSALPTLLLLLAGCTVVRPVQAPDPASAVDVPESEPAPERIALPVHADEGFRPAALLDVLGAVVEPTADGARIVLFDDTLRFAAGSPFFTAGGRIFQLVSAPRRVDGALHLPHQFFAEWLPRHHAGRLAMRGDTLVAAAGAWSDAGVPRGPVGDPAAVHAADGSEPPDGAAADDARRTPPAARPRADTARARGGEADRRPGVGRVVVLDPGHGGRDPGRVASNGLNEKDVVLRVGRRLADVLRQRGYEVHLTRTTDTLIALADRPRLANRWKAGRPAALFLSIHANAWRRSRVRGYETYFLSEARTEDERRVAEMENAAVRYEDEPDAGADALDYILNHLRNDFYVRASNALAEEVQRALGDVHPGPSRGVKQAGFRMLIGALMPAVLVELAFITNRTEAALLASDEFQRDVSRTLADAVDRFFATHEHLWMAEDSR